MKNILRRKLLVAGAKSAIALGSIGAFKPLSVFAQSANPQSAPTNLTDALKSIGATNAANSKDILIKAPDIAENGALVPIEITSNIPGTQTIYIIADKNPQPITSNFTFLPGAEPFIATRIKMGETSNIRAVVNAGGKFYTAMKEVKITIGGCGG